MSRESFLDAVVPSVATGFSLLVAFGVLGAFLQGSIELETLRAIRLDAWPLAAAPLIFLPLAYATARRLAARGAATIGPVAAGAGVGASLGGVLAHAGGILAVAIAVGTVRGPAAPTYVNPFGHVTGTEVATEGMLATLGVWLGLLMVPLGIAAGFLARWGFAKARTVAHAVTEAPARANP